MMAYSESDKITADIKERLNGINEFMDNEFHKVVQCEKFYDNPNKYQNIYNRVLDHFVCEIKKSANYGKFKNVRNCEVLKNSEKRLEMCHRGGTVRCVNNKQKFYCDEHERQRVHDYDAYHCFNLNAYEKNGCRKPLEVQRQAAMSHSRRLKYRYKYNIELDSAHSAFESRLQYIHNEHFKVRKKDGQMVKVSF